MAESLRCFMALLVVIATIVTLSINFTYHNSGYHDLHRDNSPVKQLLNAYKDAGKPTPISPLERDLNTPKKTSPHLEPTVLETPQNIILSSLEPGYVDETKYTTSYMLDCTAYGWPSNEFIHNEMVYWKNAPRDSKYVSPFKKTDGEAQYLTFEPDHGGWNNIRMAMETVIVFAHSMGRTLVLPPEAPMYLLSSGLDFHDFFHLDALAAKHDGIDIISMEEFLKREALSGQLKNTDNGEVALPPANNKTNWDNENLIPLWNYLRTVGTVPAWDLENCLPAFPKNSEPDGLQRLTEMMDTINTMPRRPTPADYKDKPIQVDSSTMERLKESLAERKELCLYDSNLQNTKLIHFKVDDTDSTRLLMHFYSVMFFEEWRHDLFYKRFVRDNIRYTDQLMCTAAKLVQVLRIRAIHRDPADNKEGHFDALHIRRGDFQYKSTRLDAKAIYEKSKDFLNKNSVLYIATDERDKNFFNVFKEEGFDVVFLDDFANLYEGLDDHFMGMLDQLVAFKSQRFVGTWWSTFSGYINRIKGYDGLKNKKKGWMNGEMKSWYFAPDERIDEMQQYTSVRPPYYMREFPTAWRDIDKTESPF